MVVRVRRGEGVRGEELGLRQGREGLSGSHEAFHPQQSVYQPTVDLLFALLCE